MALYQLLLTTPHVAIQAEDDCHIQFLMCTYVHVHV